MNRHTIGVGHEWFDAISRGATEEIAVNRAEWDVNVGDAIRFVEDDGVVGLASRTCVRYALAVEKGFPDTDAVWLRDPADDRSRARGFTTEQRVAAEAFARDLRLKSVKAEDRDVAELAQSMLTFLKSIGILYDKSTT